MTPPSTFRIAPVTQLAWSDSRNVVAEATSDAVPTRPSGWNPLNPRRAWSICSGGMKPSYSGVAIIRDQGSQSLVAAAVGRDLKGKASPFSYVGGIGLSSAHHGVGIVLYTVVAPIWLVPDRRLERTIAGRAAE